MIYFTSDLHFMHKNIIKYNRPYCKDVMTMNHLIVDTINAEVSREDTLYILGDIALGSINAATALLGRIKCNIKIVPGNHDSNRALNRYKELGHVEILPPLTEVKIEDQHIVLCHFPMVSWNRAHHGAWQLFGHTHGSYVGQGKSIDVGWDNHVNEYGVAGIFSFDDLKVIMQNKEFEPISHHKGDE